MKKAKPLHAVSLTWSTPVVPDTTLILPSPSNPMAVARRFVEALYMVPPGRLLLRTHRGDFFSWQGTYYGEITRADVHARAYAFVEHAVYLHPDKGPQPFAPTQRKMADLLDALRAITHVESGPDAPLWIDHRTDPSVTDTIAMTNGLLDVRTRILHPHEPLFFNHHALPFAFDPKATIAAAWQRFLHDLWPDDDQAITSLQEVIGYLLTADTRQQKAFLVVGPKRGGKGTIGRVITGLLGPHNVAAPTLASLATNFGLQPLIGKPLALISDARLSTRADSKVVVERLLSISGEDSLTIDRKYRDPWTGRLPTRFFVLSNELPKLSDASGALASRFVLFVLQRSFYGAENPQLTTELLAEAPAIFNWALEGLDRLNTRGYFETPASGADAIRQMEDLSSPISAFIRDRCVVARQHAISAEDLWTAWKRWCSEENYKLSTRQLFGRDLKAALPGIRRVRPRPDGPADRPDDAPRPYVYEGLKLREHYSADSMGPLGPDASRGPNGPIGPNESAMYPSPEERTAKAEDLFRKGWR
jgi:putative DNA primase/helicase